MQTIPKNPFSAKKAAAMPVETHVKPTTQGLREVASTRKVAHTLRNGAKLHSFCE
jgi:hypothetical protein